MTITSSKGNVLRNVPLSYFGEEYTPSGNGHDPNGSQDQNARDKKCLQDKNVAARGGNSLQDQNAAPCCDICETGGLPLKDVTVSAQKFLSCVYRVDQRFGAAHIIDILLGSRNEKIKKFNHNFLSTWGIGTELSKQAWFELADAMQSAGLIERVGEYNIIKVTSLGKDLLQNREKIELPVRINFDSQKKASLALPKKKAVLHKKADLQNDAQTQTLAERLRSWRKKLG